MPEAYAAGLTTAEMTELVLGLQKGAAGYIIELQGAMADASDRVWFRFHRPGSPSPSFGFQRQSSRVLVVLRDLDGEGVIDPRELGFSSVTAAIKRVLDVALCVFGPADRTVVYPFDQIADAMTDRPISKLGTSPR